MVRTASILLVAWTQFAIAGDLWPVTAVHDGDTLTILVDSKRVNVRLAEIDAPELGQPFGITSRDSLRALCAGQVAEVNQTAWDDRYQRPVARVTCRQTDAGSHQVLNGMAWVFDRYADPASLLYGLQASAIGAGRGLWSDQTPVAPWEWRSGRRRSAVSGIQ